MKTFKRILVFFTFDFKTMRVFIEAYYYLGWARFLMRVPFSKLSPSLGSHMGETSNLEVSEHLPALRTVHQTIQVMSRYTFWESKCLIQAIAAMKMLEKRGIESTLYLGTSKGETGEMIAHAWLRSGPCYITGAEVMARFTVVGTFAKAIARNQKKGK